MARDNYYWPGTFTIGPGQLPLVWTKTNNGPDGPRHLLINGLGQLLLVRDNYHWSRPKLIMVWDNYYWSGTFTIGPGQLPLVWTKTNNGPDCQGHSLINGPGQLLLARDIHYWPGTITIGPDQN
jgi:hypothetical protein